MHYLCMQGLALVILVWLHSKDARAARLHVSKGHAVDNRQMSLVNGLGMRPPMGRNSWNHFQCNVNEDIIKQTADALISTGLARSGYEYINIDDCWAELGRDNQGNLASRSSSFPSGIKAVADYIHSKGLKIGIYSDAGYQTCAGQPGSLGHETQDANTFASWGIDYLKYDNCNNDGSKPEVRYPVMRDALLQTGRPIFYSLCEWGQDQPSVWAPGVGNSWRTTGDISDQWDSMMSNAEENNQWARYAGPGRWNDPDMLEVGNGNMTIEEYRVHFSLWSLMKAPLLLGCDLRNISRMYIEMLSNSEVISINQDPLGVQGRLVKRQGQVEVWAGPLSDKRIAVVLLNRGMTWATIRVTWEDVHFDKGTVVLVRDVWLHHDLSGVSVNSFQTEVENHTCKMYVMKPI